MPTSLRIGFVPVWLAAVSFGVQAAPPASTFKIPQALLALETGVVTATSVEHWDGTPYPGRPAWQQDHTVVSALRPSALWFFQRIAPRAGADACARG